MASVPTSFNLATAAEDFAGPGREIKMDERRGSEYHNGLHIWIDVNGWTFSAGWDRGMYCSGARRGELLSSTEDPLPESPDAEVAVWQGDDADLIELHGNTVEGWVSPASLLAAVAAAERDDIDGIRAALVRTEAVP